MINLSSKSTMFLKFMVPIIYTVFFGVLLLFIVTRGGIQTTLIPQGLAKLLLAVAYLIIFGFLYFFCIRLKRVEADADHLYVTNYRKYLRYPFSSISKMEKKNFGVINLVQVTFGEKGSLGTDVVFLPSNKRMNAFFAERPDLENLFFNSAN